MKKHQIKKVRDLVEPFRVNKGKKFRLKDFDPAETLGMTGEQDKAPAKAELAVGVDAMRKLQDKLYAQNQWALLLIFQAMDAAGKDSAIKHVMSGLNPQGCQVHAFKAPSSEELDHDFLWRCMKVLPNRGQIGIFNRSYYEEVLVVRVHPQILEREKIPEKLVGKRIWQERFEDIRNFESYLTRNGVVIRKFFLHVSRKEQKKRFLARIEDPEKNWKFSAADLIERDRWDDYMKAYEEMIQQTSTKEAPWYVVPADNKWFTRLVVAGAVIDTLAGLDLKYPALEREQLKALEESRAKLTR